MELLQLYTPARRAATSTAEGLFSTRCGARSASAGSSIGGDVTGTLKRPDALKSRFNNQEITDILLAVSYRGLRSPVGLIAEFLRRNPFGHT
jgi:hypothetical protein